MRDYYTTNDLKVANLKACGCFNGVECISNRKDLLERSILVEFHPMPKGKYKSKEQLTAEFDQALPDMLGSIFNVLQGALSLHPSINLARLSKMADFEKWGYCIAESMGKGYGDRFIAVYQNNQKKAMGEYKPDLIVALLIDLMGKTPKWQGRTEALFWELKKRVAPHEVVDFPTTSASMTRRINQAKKELKSNKIVFRCYKDSAGLGTIRLFKQP